MAASCSGVSLMISLLPVLMMSALQIDLEPDSQRGR